MERGSEVLIDTNAIIEAHRVQCWAAICGYFVLETVGECVAECGTGDSDRRFRTDVDIDELKQRIKVNTVSPSQTVAFRFQNRSTRINLDPGEEELLAYATTRPDAYLICSPDIAAMKMAYHLGILDRVVSLEELAVKAGRGGLVFRENYTAKWHREKCSEIRMQDLFDG